MGWEPRGSAASTGIHQFCLVWLWPRPKHTTGMAQDVGQGGEQGGNQEEGSKGRSQGWERRRERKGRMGQGQGRDGEVKGRREKKERESKRIARQGSI